MRIALLSDIHSNVFALESVLRDLEQRNVDVVVNLGDILYGPIAPQATYELLQQSEIVTICGNQDRQIFQASDEDIASSHTMQFIYRDLCAEAHDWMRELPATTMIDGEVFICHGTPNDDLIYLLEDVKSGFPSLRKDDEIIELLGKQNSPVVACGHTHIPRFVHLSNGQIVVNPGSVGLPAYCDSEPVDHVMENYSPYARYAILEKVRGLWQFEQLSVVYDYQRASETAAVNGRDDWAYSLSTGRGFRDSPM